MKISFPKQVDCSLSTGLSGRKSSQDFRQTGPRKVCGDYGRTHRKLLAVCQPRSQDISSPTPKGAREGKPWFRLVTCLPKVRVDKSTTGGRCNQVEVLSFLSSLWKIGENLSKNTAYSIRVTASTARANVEDTEKDICSV